MYRRYLLIILFFNVLTFGYIQAIAWTGKYQLAFDPSDPQYIYLQVVPNGDGNDPISDGTVVYVNFPSNTYTSGTHYNSTTGLLNGAWYASQNDIGSWQVIVKGTICNGMIIECNFSSYNNPIEVNQNDTVNILKFKLPSSCTNQTYRLWQILLDENENVIDTDDCSGVGGIYDLYSIANGLSVGSESAALTGFLTTSETPLFCVNAALAWKTVGPSTGEGLWTNKLIWEYKDENGAWIPSPVPPNNDRPIYVYHTVLIPSGSDISADSLFIRKSGIVNVNSTASLTVTDQLVFNVDVNGNAGQLNSDGSCSNITTTAAKIIVRKALDSSWDFISFPYTVNADSVYIAGTKTKATWGNISPASSGAHFFAAEYNGSARATDPTPTPSASNSKYFKNVTDSTFTAVRGYIITGGNAGADSLDFVAPTNALLAFCDATYSPENFAATPDCNGGWCLVGTPYVSKYNLYYADSYKTYYVAPVYTPVVAGNDYTLNSFGAFFMQATASTAINYVNTGLTVFSQPGGAPAYKSIELEISNALSSDKTVIRLHNEGNTDYQLGEDAIRMQSGAASIPQIYTEADGACSGLAINTLPLNTQAVDLKVRIGVVGTNSIKLAEGSDVNEVILLDTETGIQTNLTNGDTYTWESYGTGITDRFRILLDKEVTTATNTQGSDAIKVTLKNNKLSFEGINGTAHMKVYDVVGKNIGNYTDITDGSSLDLKSHGVFILDISTETQETRAKIVINKQ